jgi:DNA modification methylase
MAAKKGQGQGQVMLQIQHLPISSVRPADYNPRKISGEQMARLKRSLTEFGFVDPIIVNSRTGNIVGGHQRVAAAEALGYETVPVVEVDLDDDREKALNVALNKQGGEWDFQALPGLLAEIQAGGIDLELTGFTQDELDAMIAETAEVDTLDALTDPDDVPEPPAEPITKPGDLWILGRHRLLCGDSTVITDVERLMGGKRADMVWTDPPYNHASDDKGVAASASKAHKDLMASEWDKGFSFQSVAPSLETAIAKDCTVYVCTSWHLAGEIWGWMAKRSSHHSYCVWHKPNPMPSLMKRHWTWSSELICYATFGKHTFNFPTEGHASNVWTFNKKSDGSHPTMKPVELVEHAITHSSKNGALVLDLFGGSGSTLIAAERTGRNAYLMELDPRYCDVIVRRWEKFTGQEAALEAHHGYTDKVHP